MVVLISDFAPGRLQLEVVGLGRRQHQRRAPHQQWYGMLHLSAVWEEILQASSAVVAPLFEVLPISKLRILLCSCGWHTGTIEREKKPMAFQWLAQEKVAEAGTAARLRVVISVVKGLNNKRDQKGRRGRLHGLLIDDAQGAPQYGHR